MPSSLRAAPVLHSLSLYGNCLHEFPAAVLQVRAGGAVGGAYGGLWAASPATHPGRLADAAAALSRPSPAPALCRARAAHAFDLRPPPPGPPALQAPSLRTLWLEGNPLTPEAVAGLLSALPASGLTALGLDERQAAAAPPALLEAAAASGKLRVSGPAPSCGGYGYFKLEAAPAAAAAATNGSSRPTTEVLVVSFGSAPGTPNWGGLLKKVRGAAATPQEQNFDVLYVVDPHRSWYGGEPWEVAAARVWCGAVVE